MGRRKRKKERKKEEEGEQDEEKRKGRIKKGQKEPLTQENIALSGLFGMQTRADNLFFSVVFEVSVELCSLVMV